jgi:hypothetical protein
MFAAAGVILPFGFATSTGLRGRNMPIVRAGLHARGHPR